MFTGLIEAVGEVVATPDGRSSQLRIRTPLSAELQVGDSLAVNGVCLTITRAGDGEACADVGPETLKVTALGRLAPARLVNLERPLRTDGRLGGHFVQGHVDGVGEVESIRVDGDARWVTIRFPAGLASHFISRGSVAIDGISLTVAELDDSRLSVMIIPHTWEHTSLAAAAPGDPVNMECDMIGKYVARALEFGWPSAHDGKRKAL